MLANLFPNLAILRSPANWALVAFVLAIAVLFVHFAGSAFLGDETK